LATGEWGPPETLVMLWVIFFNRQGLGNCSTTWEDSSRLQGATACTSFARRRKRSGRGAGKRALGGSNGLRCRGRPATEPRAVRTRISLILHRGRKRSGRGDRESEGPSPINVIINLRPPNAGTFNKTACGSDGTVGKSGASGEPSEEHHENLVDI